MHPVSEIKMWNKMCILQLMYYGIRNNAANEHIAYNFHMCISVDVF